MKELIVAAAQSIATPGDLVKSVADHVRLADDATRHGAHLVVFPELSLTGYRRELTQADALLASDPRLTPLREIADAGHIAIIAGAPVRSTRGLHIGAFCFVPRCEPVTYTKQYLHPGEDIAFMPGSGGPALSVHNRTISIAICAEITHAEHPRSAAAQGAHVYVASCFITPGGYAQDTNLLQTYARSHRMAVVMANFGSACAEWASAGGSAIWSREGSMLAQGPAQGEALVTAKLSNVDDSSSDE